MKRANYFNDSKDVLFTKTIFGTEEEMTNITAQKAKEWFREFKENNNGY